MLKYGVVTYAIGTKYHQYAINLACSFHLTNSKNDIKFYIISDSPIKLNPLITNNVINIVDNELLKDDNILLNKLKNIHHIDLDQYIVIDSDCLIFSDLSPIFYKYRNEDIVMWGNELGEGDYWLGEIKPLLKANNISKLHSINGSLYIFKNNDSNDYFFHKCNLMSEKYDELKIPRIHNNLKNDEYIASIIGQQNNYLFFDFDDNVKAETTVYSRRKINLYTSYAKLYFTNKEIHKSSLLHHKITHPLIVCFDRYSINSFDYKINTLLLNTFINSSRIFKILIICIISPTLFFYYFFKYAKWDLNNNTNKI